MVGDCDFFHRLHLDRCHKRMGHVVDVKVDDILDKHGHIHKKCV